MLNAFFFVDFFIVIYDDHDYWELSRESSMYVSKKPSRYVLHFLCETDI